MVSKRDVPKIDSVLSTMNTTLDDALYYSITLVSDSNRIIQRVTQTHWVGWKDKDKKWGLRQPSLVNPSVMKNYWHSLLNQPYAVINTVDALIVFMAIGGNALVEKSVVEHHLPEFLVPDVSIPHGPTGFKSFSAFDKSVFNRTPTPALRMSILKRDDKRCRICGRRPDDNIDLRLHVHHIRPWAIGGVTDKDNLITLCQTCHEGLKPHEDHSLFEYLFPDSVDNIVQEQYDELVQKRYNDFVEGVQNYRNIILEHALSQTSPE